MSDSPSRFDAPDQPTENRSVQVAVSKTTPADALCEATAGRLASSGPIDSLDDNERLSKTASTPLRVFVSYRADQDSLLASALKRLIANSIDPEPEVFVSGDGGLRPSNVGFKQQLQDAARRAHAFVAVITNASKDREWIFFEAGAAWGQNLLYAPVLIGTQPEDLPSSIGDYQALRAHSMDDMRQLITRLAELNRCTERIRFSRRYQSFAKTLEEYHKGAPSGDESEIQDESDLALACKLMTKGEVEEANTIFDKLEQSNRADKEELFLIKYQREFTSRKTFEMLSFLHSCPDELKATSYWQYMMSFETAQPLEKLKHLRKAIEIGQGEVTEFAQNRLAKLQAQMGDHVGATKDLLRLMREYPFTKCSQRAATSLVKINSAWTPFESLMILLAGITGLDADGFREVAKVAENNQWLTLELYCRRQINSFDETSESVNSLGRIRSGLELNSLAYESFTRTAELGSGVGVVNAANLLRYVPVAAAGRALMRNYSGTFDAEDPGFPHDVRADLERTLHAEQEKETEFFDSGKQQFDALWLLAGHALLDSRMPNGRLVLRDVVLALDGSGVITSLEQGWSTPMPLQPFVNSLYYLQKQTQAGSFSEKPSQTIFVVTCTKEAKAVWFENFAKGSAPEWFVWEPSTSN